MHVYKDAINIYEIQFIITANRRVTQGSFNNYTRVSRKKNYNSLQRQEITIDMYMYSTTIKKRLTLVLFELKDTEMTRSY